MPAGVLMTVPAPAPDLFTVTVNMGTLLNVATMV
jgi:hypothetical protein